MMSPMRTIVDLPQEQLGALARLCEVQKISRAEAIRRAVDRLLKDSMIEEKNIGFGMWRNKRMTARLYVDNLRNEWSAE
jgi:metal-responsive CopG/Arc/MetJ family transcriptional regulator